MYDDDTRPVETKEYHRQKLEEMLNDEKEMIDVFMYCDRLNDDFIEQLKNEIHYFLKTNNVDQERMNEYSQVLYDMYKDRVLDSEFTIYKKISGIEEKIWNETRVNRSYYKYDVGDFFILAQSLLYVDYLKDSFQFNVDKLENELSELDLTQLL